MKINVTIPTYNRASCLKKAVDAALAQACSDFTVTIVDDGSTDETTDLLRAWDSDPRVCSIRLRKNAGTANAKNVSLMLSQFDAITFHDSDDIPHEDKLLLQSRGLALNGEADHILDWAPLGHEPGSRLEVEAVVGAHRFVKLDGSVHIIRKRISLVDDFFPTLQSPSQTEGDWILINSGMFRRSAFERLGGYLDSVEEDRELRNRLIASGAVFHFIDEPLLTKIEMASSLTTDDDTGYRGSRRARDRHEVWERNRRYRSGLWGKAAAAKMKVPVDLEHVDIESISRPELLEINDRIPATAGTLQILRHALAKAKSRTADGPAAARSSMAPEPTRAGGRDGDQPVPANKSSNGSRPRHRPEVADAPAGRAPAPASAGGGNGRRVPALHRHEDGLH